MIDSIVSRTAFTVFSTPRPRELEAVYRTRDAGRRTLNSAGFKARLTRYGEGTRPPSRHMITST